MSLVYRATKGANLTPAEVDANFAFLKAIYDALVASPPTANSLENIVQSADGSQITFYLTDSTQLGPFTLPTAVFRFVGEWAAGTGYQVGDFFTYERAGLYYVEQNHTSEVSFDETEENSDGRYYQLVMDFFSGSTVKSVASVTYTPVLLDANRYIRTTTDIGITVTVPANADVEFAIGTELHWRQAGTGAIVFNGDSGVTINAPRPGYDTVTPWVGANCTLKKVNTDIWDYIGPGEELGSS